MKIKEVLRFYFYAEKINTHIDRLILKRACDPAVDGRDGADRISLLIEEKEGLERLWAYIDGVAGGLGGEELKTLKYYSAMRVGLRRLDCESVKRIRRAGVKFVRHARRLQSFGNELKLLKKYYCLL